MFHIGLENELLSPYLVLGKFSPHDLAFGLNWTQDFFFSNNNG